MWKVVWLAALCGLALAAAPRPLIVKACRSTASADGRPDGSSPPGSSIPRRLMAAGGSSTPRAILSSTLPSTRSATAPRPRIAARSRRDSARWKTGARPRWSEDGVLRQSPRPLAYTPQWNFMSSYGRKRGGTYQLPGHTGYPNGCIFVFDPEFERFANEHARKLEATRDDPWLLGHFSDNELPFPRDSLDRYLHLPPGDPGHKEAVRWLRERKGSERARITDGDREAWRGHVAETYFRIVSRAIKRHDPNHLYLGSRFHGSEKRSEAVFRAAGKYLDVVSVNVYGVWTPSGEMLRRWAKWSGRPLLITEWYAKGADSGLPNLTGAGWTVPTQRDRGYFYQNFVLALIESGVCVGWHWFKYMDNDPEDTRADPSNQINRVAYPLTGYFDSRR